MSSQFWLKMVIELGDRIILLNKVYDLLSYKGTHYYWRAIDLHERANEMYGQAELRERIWLVEETHG